MNMDMFRLIPTGFKLSQLRYYLTVEPLGLLLYLGLAGLGTVQPQLQIMRMENTYQDDVYVDNPNTTYNDFGNAIQGYIIHWNQYRLAANIPCALFMSTFLAAWGDRNGRQINILLGIAALMIGFCFAQSMLYSYTVQAPLWTWILMTFIEGCLGNFQMSYFAGQAYQADLCGENKDELTIRMNIVSIMRSIGSAIGGALTAIFAVQVGLVMWVAVGNTVIFVAYLYIFFWVVQIPPALMEKARNEYAVKITGDRQRVETIVEKARAATFVPGGIDDDTDTSPLFIKVAKQMKVDFYEAYLTFAKPRQGYKRACIWALSAVGFVSTLGGAEAGQLIGVYLYFELGWQSSKFALWQTYGTIIIFVGQIAGVFFFKRVLKIRDTWLLNISLLSFCLSTVPIAFPSDAMMTLSNWLAVFSGITSPTLSSLITNYVEPEEVGKVLLAFSVTLLLAVVGQTYVLQEIYLATLDWFPGFMFLLIAGSTVGCMVLVQWCDWVEKPVKKVYKVDEIVEDELDEIKKHPGLSFRGERNGTVIEQRI